MEDYDVDLPEDRAHSVMPCICEHEQEQHSWASCEVEGCQCTAHLEE